jgi:ATP-binding cassette subfamily B protein
MKGKRINLEKIIVRQQDETDCGVACLLTLIRYYGGNISMERLRELSGTSKQGTTLLGLYQAAQSVGFDAEGCGADISALIAHGEPVILHVVVNNQMEHFVVCFAYSDNHFVIGDPGKGIVYYTADQLEEIWKSHVCLTLSPSNRFVKTEEITKEKRKWMLRLVHKDFQLLSISVVIGIVIAVLSMTVAVFSQKLIDEIIPDRNYHKLWLGMALVFILLFTRIALSALRQYILYVQSKNFNNRIIRFFYNKLLRLPKSFFDSRKTGDMVARLNDTRRIQTVISTLAGDFIINVLSAIATLFFLLFYSTSIAIALACIIPILIYLVYRFNASIIRSQNEVMVWYAHSESNFIHTIQGIDTIKSFHKQLEFGRTNRFIYNTFQNSILSLGKINIRLSLLSGVLTIIVITLTIGYGSALVFREQLKTGELMAIISLVASIMPAIVSLALITIPINEAKVAFNRMFELVGVEAEEERGELIKESVSKIELRNVSFRFAGRKRILFNVSATFKKGNLTLIVGESGCGKSTLCHLLTRSYYPEEGKIILNTENNLADIALSDWRNRMGVVAQDIFIFNGTIMENICLGIHQVDMQRALDCCNQFGITPYIESLPQSYATIVGEDGINLSGGQKQLIAFARLLVRMPEVMILDEPTSAMDKEMELLVLNILSELKTERIIIVVSHHLQTMEQYADQVIRI